MPTFIDNIGASGEADRFAMELVAGRTYCFDLRREGSEIGSLHDGVLALYGSG